LVGNDDLEAGVTAKVSTNRLSGTEALKAHLTLALGLALCATAFSIEIGRAIGGNALSWAYVFEWPLLGAFVVYMWWRVIHPERPVRASKEPTIAPEFDGMLAAWRDHQRELARTQAPTSSPEREAK
jgi:hypothetical protein